MRGINVRELQHHLGRLLDEVEAGEVLEIRRRKKVIAHLVPHVAEEPAEPWPDLVQRVVDLYPDGPIAESVSQLLYADRDRDGAE